MRRCHSKLAVSEFEGGGVAAGETSNNFTVIFSADDTTDIGNRY
jgi:hypothetical protein